MDKIELDGIVYDVLTIPDTSLTLYELAETGRYKYYANARNKHLRDQIRPYSNLIVVLWMSDQILNTPRHERYEALVFRNDGYYNVQFSIDAADNGASGERYLNGANARNVSLPYFRLRKLVLLQEPS